MHRQLYTLAGLRFDERGARLPGPGADLQVRVHRRWPAVALLVLGVLVVRVGTSSAATFTAACSGTIGDPTSLVAAIDSANAAGGANVVQLGAGCTYTLTAVNNNWYGPNGLPAIASDVTIAGNGATIARSSAPSTPPFRFFFVGANSLVNHWVSPGAGDLTLNNVTLTGGLAQGGEGFCAGGGGAGMGGAIFSQGVATIEASTVTANTAEGGAGSSAPIPACGDVGGGGGIGSSATDLVGGGFGGAATSFGTDPGTGGAGTTSGSSPEGGGGAGFRMGENGQNATPTSPGSGGGPDTGLGGVGGDHGGASGDGGAGGDGIGGAVTGITGGNGGGFGFGGDAGNDAVAGGGGGVGGGGGPRGGAGGFGGGGAGVGNGGFGGGGGGSYDNSGGAVGAAGFGGGNPLGDNSGGGAGMGGAVFTMGAQLTVVDSTFTDNAAVGGTDEVTDHAKGIGGAVFNLNGTFDAVDSTFAGNIGDTGASQIYNIDYDAHFAHLTQATLRDTIVYGGAGGASDVGSLLVGFGVSGASANADLSHFDLVGTMSAQSAGAITGTPLTTNPDLGPLENNGGPTQTMALRDNSPAINAGDPGCDDLNGTPIHTDQRGVARPQGSACDIGAYEVAPPSITSTGAAAGTTSADIGASVNPNEQDATVAVRFGTSTAYGSTTPAQDIESGNTPVGFNAHLTGLTPGTTYHAQITAANADGSSTSSDITFTTTDTSTSPPPAAKPPSVSNLAQSTVRWRERRALPRNRSRRPPLGTTFRFALDQPAAVRFAFVRSFRGRRVGRKCVAQHPHNQHHMPCTGKLASGTLHFEGHPGINQLRFRGRISGANTLAPGNYTLTVTAIGTTGLTSIPRTLSFTILTS
jgi:hypothetical protein